MQWRMKRPRWWAWVLLAIGLVFFGNLSLWQWRRAAEKEVLLRDYAAALKSIPRADLADAERALKDHALGYLPVSLGGSTQAIVLRDNQSHQGQPGVHVLRELNLFDGRSVLVNEGWWPMSKDRRLQAWPSAAFDDQTIVYGLLTAWPVTPTWLQMQGDAGQMNGMPMIVQLNRESIERVLPNRSWVDGVVLRWPEENSPFVRQWHPNVFPPERHRGYAVTWAVFFFLSIFLFWLLNRKHAP